MVAESFMNPPPGVKCSTKLEDVISAKGFDCRIDSGFSWNIVDASPDSNEIQSMCQSARCRVMFESMRAVATTECVTSSGWYLYADLLNPILKGCESLPTPVTSGEAPFNGTSSSTTTSTPAAVAPGASTTLSPGSTTAPPVVDTGSQIVDTALSRGTIIAILSAGAVVLTTVSALVRFCYNRRQQKKKQAEAKEGAGDGGDDENGRQSKTMTPFVRGGGYDQSSTPTKPKRGRQDEDDNDSFNQPKDDAQTDYGLPFARPYKLSPGAANERNDGKKA